MIVHLLGERKLLEGRGVIPQPSNFFAEKIFSMGLVDLELVFVFVPFEDPPFLSYIVNRDFEGNYGN